MISCNQDSEGLSIYDNNVGGFTRVDANISDADFSSLDTFYCVTDKDVEAYIHFKKLVAKNEKRDLEIIEVVPMRLKGEATLAYLLNYNEGWEIISADKRAPIVLASGDEGHFDLKEVPENIMTWIESLEADVLQLRLFSKRPFWANDSVWKKMRGSIDFWCSLNGEIESRKELTRGKIIPPPITVGRWELIDSYRRTLTLQKKGPLIQTAFNQEDPYNNCCPYCYNENDMPVHAPAGCVAIAGAQMAYYLHYKIGAPQLAASTGSCFGIISNQPNQSDSIVYHSITVGNYSSTIWDSMLAVPSNASYLIADIGKSVRMAYSMGGSSASTYLLETNYFYPSGVSCSYNEYIADSVISSIKQREMPVILAAHDIYHNNTGHAFIADGYKKIQDQIVNVYRWTYLAPPSELEPIPQDSVQTINLNPVSEYLHMNWGYGPYYNGDNAWYAPSGNWTVGDYSYNESRHMLYQFSRIEE